MSRKTDAEASPDRLPAALSKPARRALAAAGITRLEQFTALSEAELLKLHGLGPKGITTIREAMSDQGLEFADPERSIKVHEEADRLIPKRAPRRGE